ncbi:hypothetical protein [Nocardia alni]|uniref:hypothetical protein n=1 Tax=Nocardia alni TaxID=2815723 RepID=UPI001C21D287|nr:hypothetical protein [Nocardia alni]
MSDDDAATDSTNADSADDPTTKADRTSADADVTAEAGTDTSKDAPKQDTASKAEPSSKGEATEEKTVKMPAAEATPAYAESARPPALGPASRNWTPIIGAFAAGVVVVAAVAAVAVFWKQDHDRGNDLSARDSAVAAACDFGHQVGTYDAANFDDYVNRVKQRSTGDWLTQFEGASSALKQITQQAQARSTVSEIHCAWESGDPNNDNASVVMLITQNQSKAATPQPQHLTIGVVASLQKKDGKWLVGNFQSPMTNDLQDSAPAPGAQAPAPGAPATPGAPGN